MFWSHAECGAESVGDRGVEGRSGLGGWRLVHVHKVGVRRCGDYGLFGQDYGLSDSTVSDTRPNASDACPRWPKITWRGLAPGHEDGAVRARVSGQREREGAAPV
ncbi:hypothetical protein GCM10010307_16590 [Streptomyces vastus]|uniref:Uncharacterized protein n=1 Tax=Streptomyces vastus TaxID=285451 RepID=A0ABP6CWG8_9ACTN